MKKAGFTLLELMVALTVSSVLVASILGLLIGQGRAVDRMRGGADQLEQVQDRNLLSPIPSIALGTRGVQPVG